MLEQGKCGPFYSVLVSKTSYPFPQSDRSVCHRSPRKAEVCENQRSIVQKDGNLICAPLLTAEYTEFPGGGAICSESCSKLSVVVCLWERTSGLCKSLSIEYPGTGKLHTSQGGNISFRVDWSSFPRTLPSCLSGFHKGLMLWAVFLFTYISSSWGDSQESLLDTWVLKTNPKALEGRTSHPMGHPALTYSASLLENCKHPEKLLPSTQNSQVGQWSVWGPLVKYGQ